MKVLLTMIPKQMEFKDKQNSFMPLSIYVLARYVECGGYSVDIECYPTPSEIDYTKWCEYDLIGFSTNSFNYAESLEVAENVKNKNRSVKILFGGIHVTRLPDDALSNEFIDYVICGEGENAIVKLLNSNFEIDLVKNIPGVSYKYNGEIVHNPIKKCIVLDESTLIPSYELIKEKIENFSFEISRGCLNRCTFCSIDHQYPWRGFEKDLVIKRIEKAFSMIEDVNSVKSITTTDDCFTTDPNRACTIIRDMHQKYPNIQLRVEARVKDILKSSELLEAFSECNMGMIQFGIECGYDEGLAKIRKGIKISEIVECAKRLNEKKLGHCAFYSYIIGLPWETKDDCLKTISFAEEMLNEYNIPGNIVFWLPLPSNLAEEYGLINAEWYRKKGWYNDMDIFFKSHSKLTINDFNELIPKIKSFLEKSYKILNII